MTIDTIRARVTSVCEAEPFRFTTAQTPFSFDLQPSGQIDEVFRIEATPALVVGGFNYTEERTDILTIWVARKYHSDPELSYRQLLVDITSVRAAVIRDGVQVSGEYCVPDDGWNFDISRELGREFAVGRLMLPVNYESEL